MTAVDARLVREIDGGTTAPWLLVEDAENPESGLSDPVVDYGARILLTAIGVVLSNMVTELSAKIEAGESVELGAATLSALESIVVSGVVALDAPTLAALESITATISGSVDVTGPLTDVELRASPLAVTATDLDIRNLTDTADSVRSVDAAEDAGLIALPFTITATGPATLVAAPGVGNGRLRLRRLSPTYAIRSPDSEPILQLHVGALEAQRGNALTGRFDITATDETDEITLTVDVLDASGRVTGTVYYEVVA